MEIIKELALPITIGIENLLYKIGPLSNHWRIIAWQITITFLVAIIYGIAMKITKVEGSFWIMLKASFFSLTIGFAAAFVANIPSLSGFVTIFYLNSTYLEMDIC